LIYKYIRISWEFCFTYILDHRFLGKQDCVTKEYVKEEHEMNRGLRTNPVSEIVQGIIDKVMVFHHHAHDQISGGFWKLK
jgi:hypothetical protein